MSHYSTHSWNKQPLAKTASVLLLFALALPWPGTAVAAATTTTATGTTTNQTSINTGDAQASSGVTNLVNTNTTTSGSSSAPTTGSSTPPSASTTTPIASSTATSTVTIAPAASGSSTATNTRSSASEIATSSVAASSSNQAVLSNAGTTTASTGGNAASSSAGATITTGDAVAYTNVLNLANTTITDASGLIAFLNNVLGIHDFNFQNDFATVFGTSTAESTYPCVQSCGSTATLVSTTSNNATITNNITVGANTGDNGAHGSSTSITTGDATAAANIVNVANTNITNSKYLLVVFNNLSDFNGNLVLPNSSFFSQFLAAGAGGGTQTQNSNTATISNNVTATANTGTNAASSSQSGISTGNASAGSSVVNTANQNFLGTNSFSMLIHVYGTWSGNIYGLPPGMSWMQTPEGIRIFSHAGGATTTNGIVSNSNTANIQNNVHVYALTGNNETTGSTSSITTGAAHAGASIYNLANTNIIGSNWASMVFNIFGNWNGSLSFGQPDLWLGAEAKSPDNPIMPGSTMTYTYTIFNRGDLPATNIVLDTSYQKGALAFTTGTSSVSGNTGHTRWTIGTLAPGATKVITRSARVTNVLPGNRISLLPLTGTVTEQEPDAHTADNSDTVVMNVGRLVTSGGGGSGTETTFPANVVVSNSADRTTAHPGDTIHYTLKAKNNGGELFKAALIDIVRDPTGKIVQNQLWPLDTFGIDDAVQVSFDLQLDQHTATGTYTNTAQVIGFDNSRLAAYQQAYSSPVATTTFTVLSGATGQVLGASSTPATCPPYLTTYLKYGQANNPLEVMRLQGFLNQALGTNVSLSGIFGRTTEAAVKRFQSQYAGAVLAPWGLSAPTGYVYFTTQQKINQLQCGNSRTFPLTSAQQIVITRARHNPPNPSSPTGSSTVILAMTPSQPIEQTTTTPPKRSLPHLEHLTASTTPIPPSTGTTASVTAVVHHLFSRLQAWLPSWF